MALNNAPMSRLIGSWVGSTASVHPGYGDRSKVPGPAGSSGGGLDLIDWSGYEVGRSIGQSGSRALISPVSTMTTGNPSSAGGMLLERSGVFFSTST